MIDLLCMGRAAVDLYADQIGTSLENASSFSKYVGGCPANIAIGAARLGLKTGILSAVGDEAMGRFVEKTLIEEGVDVSHLITKPGHLTGLAILGIDPPDNFPLLFYRENCSDMALNEGDFSLETFKKTKSLLITGTHCSTESMFHMTKKAVILAKNAGCKVILDIDYRPVLWKAAGLGEGEERYVHLTLFADRLEKLMASCDVIVGTEEEILAASGEETIGAALLHIREQTGALIVQKRGEKGCIAYPGEIADPVPSEPFSIKVLNVLGAGDAFMSGFLRGWLGGENLKTSLEWGNANGALVVSRHGCSPAMPYAEELKAFIENPKNLGAIETIHRHRARRLWQENVYFLAIDHRTYFEGASKEKVKIFKSLVIEALEQLKKDSFNIGVILDGRYRTSLPTFRCLEEPAKVPLKFLGGKEARLILNDWPKEVGVKVLCPITEYEDDVIEPLGQVYDACISTDRELLIEFVFPSLNRIAELIEHCYRAGIYPDWWKLPAIGDAILWKHICTAIRKYDPSCGGILLLGQNQPLKKLIHDHRKIRAVDEMIKGFAVGRSIWGPLAEKYFNDRIEEKEIIEQVKQNFMELIYDAHDSRSGAYSVS